MSSLITVNDPVSGMPNYSYRTAPIPWDSDYEFTDYLLDHDQRSEHPWATYEITWQGYGSSIVLESARITWDDGSSVLHEQAYYGSLGNNPRPLSETYTRADAQDRITSVTEFYVGGFTPFGLLSDTAYSQTEFVAGTSRVDYSYVVFSTGRIEAKDFNADTGLIDYAYTVFVDGRTLAEDFDAAGRLDFTRAIDTDGKRVDVDYDPRDGAVLYVATYYAGEGHTLGQLFTGGRLDYETETFADGRIIATDYDLNDEYAWTWMKVAYSSAYVVESVSIG